MNRAEYINAVVKTAVEKQLIHSREATRILDAVVTAMNRAGHMDDNLDEIYWEVHRRYDWVMVQEDKKPW